MHPYAPSLPSKWRLLSAFAILPLVDALVAFVLYPTLWWLPTTAVFRAPDTIQVASGFAILAGVVGLLVTTCGALPVVFWLLRRGPLSFAQLALAGLALGNMPFAIYAVAMIPFAIGHLVAGTMAQHLAPLSELLAGAVRALVIGSMLGVMSAVVFWLVGVHRFDVD